MGTPFRSRKVDRGTAHPFSYSFLWQLYESAFVWCLSFCADDISESKGRSCISRRLAVILMSSFSSWMALGSVPFERQLAAVRQSNVLLSRPLNQEGRHTSLCPLFDGAPCPFVQEFRVCVYFAEIGSTEHTQS